MMTMSDLPPQPIGDCFHGSDYEPAKDRKRLTGQILRILDLMSDQQWRTVDEIEQITGFPGTSISAQLRNLRKEEGGAYTVPKRRRGGDTSALWEYRLGTPGSAPAGRTGRDLADRMAAELAAVAPDSEVLAEYRAFRNAA
jgi:hypothetical protein